jgi:hypothetical protein
LAVKDRILADVERVLFPYFQGIFVIPGKPGQVAARRFSSSSSQALKGKHDDSDDPSISN